MFHKTVVSVKVVRAKLTGPWEGGGIGGKKHFLCKTTVFGCFED